MVLPEFTTKGPKLATILGISAYYHDSAAALVVDGRIVAAAQEERFSRRKHDPKFPRCAIEYCLSYGDVSLQDIDGLVFYDKPLVKFERLLETYLAYAPKGFRSFLAAMPVWLKEKLYLKQTLRKEFVALGGCEVSDLPELLFAEHHQSHAASAFFPSPFKTAAVLCLDGVGEWATTTAWQGQHASLSPMWEIDFPHSLGLLYSAFTYFAGFKVNSGEYKLMGLAPYGEPIYESLIYDELVDLKEDGSFRLNMRYFNYCAGLTMTNGEFAKLFGGPHRQPDSDITQREMDLAASVQKVTEDIVLRLAKTLREETGEKNLCLAGGVALNCVANGRVLREAGFDHVWIQPAAGDAGGSLGAALAVAYNKFGDTREINPTDSMCGSFLGPQFEAGEVARELDAAGAIYRQGDHHQLLQRVAELLAAGYVVGWFQGPMEFGPRALGGRSILGDPRSETMQSRMNLKIKFRESFRPFAPAVRAERVHEYFDQAGPSPYMLFVGSVHPNLLVDNAAADRDLRGFERLSLKRSEIPAVTHVDNSARIQTVHRQTNPNFYGLLEAFEERTNCAVLINTSFNVRGEPIVCTPRDAFSCFMRTEMDYLMIENCLLSKVEQKVSATKFEQVFDPD